LLFFTLLKKTNGTTNTIETGQLTLGNLLDKTPLLLHFNYLYIGSNIYTHNDLCNDCCRAFVCEFKIEVELIITFFCVERFFEFV
jgi:hypothetical protein